MKEHFFDLLKQAENAAFTDGDFDRAVELQLEAEEWAREHGDQELVDRAFCNRCACLIELNQAGPHIPRLKEILLRSAEPWTRWMAAYHTAMAYDLENDTEKAFSYAERARELSHTIDDPVPHARCAFLLGTLALRRADFETAERAYLEAVAAHRKLDGYHRVYESLAKENLGYVMLCTDRIEGGIELCEDAFRELQQRQGDFILHEVLQDLCYGHLLADNLDRAEECGARALDLAHECNDELIVKNCLFLLSEVAVRRGDAFRARRLLRELTAMYPEIGVSEELIDVFLETDLTQVVNLRG
jgi:tetratricopeptide (TPR) repeat protein